MANLFGRTPTADQGRSVPTGETIGSYTSYLDAQKAVDYLADEKFPVRYVSIVGNDLKMVERVTGKLSYPRVALTGAMTGAWFGLFIGVMLSFFDSAANAGQMPLNVMTSVLLGAALWMLFAIIGYAAQRGRRDFTSTNQVLASSYDVIVAPDVAGDARRLLAQLPMKSNVIAPRPGGAVPGGHLPPAQPPAGPAPARPEAWHDPYAPVAGDNAAVDDAATSNDRPGQAPLTGPSRGQFPDLPDGRPQYGIRVEPVAPPAGADTAQAPAQAAAAQPGEPAQAQAPAPGADPDGPAK
ncbi:general stress protein [Specibacter sp. NPDC057265]|uniref:general stress protein n=1 Tax=Specibacter sp. NPDC057265 TaxID=3346075 RepID=UPI003636E4D3